MTDNERSSLTGCESSDSQTIDPSKVKPGNTVVIEWRVTNVCEEGALLEPVNRPRQGLQARRFCHEWIADVASEVKPKSFDWDEVKPGQAFQVGEEGNSYFHKFAKHGDILHLIGRCPYDPDDGLFFAHNKHQIQSSVAYISDLLESGDILSPCPEHDISIESGA